MSNSQTGRNVTPSRQFCFLLLINSMALNWGSVYILLNLHFQQSLNSQLFVEFLVFTCENMAEQDTISPASFLSQLTGFVVFVRINWHLSPRINIWTSSACKHLTNEQSVFGWQGQKGNLWAILFRRR